MIFLLALDSQWTYTCRRMRPVLPRTLVSKSRYNPLWVLCLVFWSPSQWRVDSACLWGQPVQSLFPHLGVSLRSCWVLEHSHRKDDSSLECIHKGSVPSSSPKLREVGVVLRASGGRSRKIKSSRSSSVYTEFDNTLACRRPCLKLQITNELIKGIHFSFY